MMPDTKNVSGQPADPEQGPAVFWEGAAQGRLLVPRCRGCGKAHWYPRNFCPHCFSGDIEWQENSNQGTIYSYTIIRRAGDPYVVAYVALGQGVTMMTNIIDCDHDAIRIGMPVKPVFKPDTEGRPIPMFTPI